jgi:hypothetical protein
VTIATDSGSLAQGYVFLGPDTALGAVPPVSGPEILDNQGRMVWFNPVPNGYAATDFRVQTYKGNPVLTWMQSANYGAINPSEATGYILDASYNLVATVVAGNGYNADQHEFQLTPDNTALIVIYKTLQADLSSVGGSANGYVTEGMLQEIDVATGNVIFDWESLPDVPLTESYEPVPSTTTLNAPYDYFHINSVKLDTDGNLLISSRHTWTVYKVNRKTGAIIWRLGGKNSSYSLGPGLPFAWQHDVEAVDSTTLRIFDNESNGVPVLPYSRVIWVNHNDTTMTASIVQTIIHPQQLSVLAEGSAQSLNNGDTFVEWGILGRYSEFNSAGQLIYDASQAPGYGSYRGYRFAWTGTPSAGPAITGLQNSDGTISVHANWNGATGVSTWEVLGIDSSGAQSVLSTAPWNGLDTEITIPSTTDGLEVVALNSTGTPLGTSNSISGPFASVFSTQPVSQTIANGGTVVFSAVATGDAPTYQWMFNGMPLSDGSTSGTVVSGSAGSRLVISGVTAANAGSYSCLATILGNAAGSDATTLAVSDGNDVGRLVNVSARALVGTGSNVLIAGFVVGGRQAAGNQDLLIRASGPALAQFGVAGTLPDPELTLIGSGAQPVIFSSNSGWGGSSTVATAASTVGAFAWSNSASLDEATVRSLPAGSCTAEVSGASGDGGVALAEVYDATPAGSYTPSIPHLVNISARARVGTGPNVLIAGFVIGGTTSKTVLIRASGPALASFGVTGTLPDPELMLYDSTSNDAPLASDSGWAGDRQIAAAAASVGAFAWSDTSSADSALFLTLPPGPYTVEVLGRSGDTGVALVEVYEVQ